MAVFWNEYIIYRCIPSLNEFIIYKRVINVSIKFTVKYS